MEFAAYVHDVEHVVLDNLQFMTPAGGAGRSFDKWAAQDAAVAKFRDFATRRSVHAILVAEITSTTRLECDRIRMCRHFFCASRTRREQSIRPKVSQNDRAREV